jgi:peroxiredoxin
LAPQLARLQERQRDQLQVVMVSRGELSDNRPKAREHELTFPVLLQKGWQVSKDYAMFATPVAYLIDDHGVIAEDVAVGSDAILHLGQPVAA